MKTKHSALVAALDGRVARHATLRTAFATGEEGLVQRTDAPASLPLPAVDLAALPAARREGELARLAERFAAEG